MTEDDNGRYECQLHSSNGDAGADILVKIPPKESEFNIFGWQIVKNFVDKNVGFKDISVILKKSALGFLCATFLAQGGRGRRPKGPLRWPIRG